ncbi:phosphotransferase [Actinomadura monticuli]|uniref:Aminoglycoside phosphotransferase family protein n=1 Tax=Actinomadura monticuli TaxID=3097367 RepID=A0ABV4Q580_9ACTN
MLLPLAGLNQEELVGVLVEQYGADPGPLEFMPLGADSWCYRLGDLWVSVRRDLRGHSPAPYEAARRLRANGLDFVLAPIAGADGRVSRTVGGRPVVVFPYLPVSEVPASLSPLELWAVSDMVAGVHAATVDVDLPAETYTLPFGDDLDRALDVARSGPPDTGPYSLPFHALLRAAADRVEALRAEFADLAARCAAAGRPPVLTHGEPGAGNVLRHGASLLLADWGELMYGPPERDFYHLVRSFGGTPRGRRHFLRFYEIRWLFNELTEYAAWFFAPHTGDAEDREAWAQARRCLPVRP